MQTMHFEALWRGKFLILTVTGLTLLVGFGYLQRAVPMYESEARVLVVRNVTPGSGQRMTAERYFLATQAEIMASPVIVSRAMELLPEGTDIDPEELLKSVMVSQMDDTDILSVLVRNADQDVAVNMVSAVVQAYEEYARDIEQQRTSDSVQALVDREREISDELVAAQKDYVELRQESPLVGLTGEGIRIPLSRLQQIADELSAATRLRFNLENQLRLVQGQTPDNNTVQLTPEGFSLTMVEGSSGEESEVRTIPLAELVLTDDTQGQHILDELRRLQNEKSSVLQQFGERHPRLRALNEQVVSIQSELERHRTRVIARLNQELGATKVLERELAGRYDAQVRETKAMDQFIVSEEQLQARIGRLGDTQQTIIETLAAARLAEEELARGRGSIDVRILEGPALEGAQVWPRKSLVMSVCGMLGFGCGCVLALAGDLRRRKPEPVAA